MLSIPVEKVFAVAVTEKLRAVVLRWERCADLSHGGAQTGAFVTPQVHTGATSAFP